MPSERRTVEVVVGAVDQIEEVATHHPLGDHEELGWLGAGTVEADDVAVMQLAHQTGLLDKVGQQRLVTGDAREELLDGHGHTLPGATIHLTIGAETHSPLQLYVLEAHLPVRAIQRVGLEHLTALVEEGAQVCRQIRTFEVFASYQRCVLVRVLVRVLGREHRRSHQLIATFALRRRKCCRLAAGSHLVRVAMSHRGGRLRWCGQVANQQSAL
mmetsp:Transcript_6685/g.16879  ORF Transcript_6685/g.16879 Transcript_6685/m.16879 type:complete len:214 (-) Transcript_6685:13-654(-)